MRCFAGVDIGSTAIKIVLIDEAEEIRAYKITPTGSHFHRNTLEALDALLEDSGIRREEVLYITSTGYGRKLFKEADETVSEITANAVGALRAGGACGRIRTVINIGGQDSKVILLDDDGHVSNFVMNDRCAAGTGRFLEMAARNLEVGVDELGEYHLNCRGAPVVINSTCTVFAESEIISLLAENHDRGEIIAGIHHSIARRTLRLAKRIGIEEKVLFDGGPALNRGLVAAMEDELMREVVVPDLPQITTALGAALVAKEAFISRGEDIHV